MKKYAAGGTDPSKKKARLTKRADKTMTRAQKTWRNAEASKAEAIKSGMPSDEVGTNQLYAKAGRQETRAKKLKAKAGMLQKGGTLKKASKGVIVKMNGNQPVQKVAGSKGVKSGVNPKAAASKRATGRAGGTSTAPKTATPKAMYGMSMRRK